MRIRAKEREEKRRKNSRPILERPGKNGLNEGSAWGNWDPGQGQQPFIPTPNMFGDCTTTLRRLLIGAEAHSSRDWLLDETHLSSDQSRYHSASYHLSALYIFPIRFLLSEAFLSLLRVTLTHFTLSSYERVFYYPLFLFRVWSHTSSKILAF